MKLKIDAYGLGANDLGVISLPDAAGLDGWRSASGWIGDLPMRPGKPARYWYRPDEGVVEFHAAAGVLSEAALTAAVRAVQSSIDAGRIVVRGEIDLSLVVIGDVGDRFWIAVTDMVETTWFAEP